MAEPIVTKRCTKCGIEKPCKDFQRDSQKKDGLYSSCKICANKQAIEQHMQKNLPQNGNATEYENILKNILHDTR
jgi:hypothetical protein